MTATTSVTIGATGAGHAGADVGRHVGTASGAGPGALAALMAAAQAVVADAAFARAWTAGERAAALAELDRAGDLIVAARGRVLTAEHAAGTWVGRGDRDLGGWRGRTARTGAGEGIAQVRQAQTLQAMPVVEQALTGGQVRAGHVAVLARAAAKAPEPLAAVMHSPTGQAELLALATGRDTRDYARAVERWVARHDPAATQRAHDNQRERRFLHLSHTPGGTHIKGLLDSVAGHTLQLALEAASPRPAPDDDRAPEQRRADALATLAERLLGDPRTTPGALVRPHVSLVLREETFAALRATRTHAGDGAAPHPEPDRGGTDHLLAALSGAPPPTTEDGAPVPASEIARILCDCEITRIVVDTDSVPVDLGRTARLHSPAQRRAIAHRDGGCAWAGCQIPARWCEIHHPRWWTRDGGATSVENGVMICAFHHHEVHRRDLAVTRTTTTTGTTTTDTNADDAPPDIAGRSVRGTPAGPEPQCPDGPRRTTATARAAPTARATATYTFTLPDGRILAGPHPGAPPGGVDGQSRDRPRQIEPGSSTYSP